MSHDDSSWEDIYDSGQLERQLQNFDSDQLEPVRYALVIAKIYNYTRQQLTCIILHVDMHNCIFMGHIS